MKIEIMNLLTVFGVLIFHYGCVQCQRLKTKNDLQSTGGGNRKDGVRPMDDPLIQELQSEKFSKFDHNLLTELSKQNRDKNIVISPISVKTLLSLLVEGSSGDTATEIFQALQLQDRQSGLPLLRKLHSFTRNDRSSITLKSGSKIYKASDVSVKREYETIVKNYGADVETMDFSNPEIAAAAINKKVDGITHGLIRSVVEEGENGTGVAVSALDMIDANTRLFLLNFVYLKAAWDMAFNPSATHQHCFYPATGRCQQVKFMYTKRDLNYTYSDEYKSEIFEIPFKDPRYRIVFMLPHKNANVYDVLRVLERKSVSESLKKFAESSVNLYLPRTAIEFSGNMVGTLKKLGVNSAFGPSAKLDNMVKNERLNVGNIVHKARIELNEEGAEAAAVSGGNIQFLSLDTDRSIMMDRPFLFFIRDTTIAGFLFEGVVFSPDPNSS